MSDIGRRSETLARRILQASLDGSETVEQFIEGELETSVSDLASERLIQYFAFYWLHMAHRFIRDNTKQSMSVNDVADAATVVFFTLASEGGRFSDREIQARMTALSTTYPSVFKHLMNYGIQAENASLRGTIWWAMAEFIAKDLGASHVPDIAQRFAAVTAQQFRTFDFATLVRGA